MKRIISTVRVALLILLTVLKGLYDLYVLVLLQDQISLSKDSLFINRLPTVGRSVEIDTV